MQSIISRTTWISTRAGIVIALLLTMELGAKSQPPSMSSQLQFEIASIKPNAQVGDNALRGTWVECQGADGVFGRPTFLANAPTAQSEAAGPRGRCVGTKVTLLTLIATAYDIPSTQVSGGPNWLREDAFQIEAKAESPATVTTEQLRLMLQNLLKDRFKLQILHETREAQAYLLLVGKNAPRLKETTEGEKLHLQQSRGPSGEVQFAIKGNSRIDLFADMLHSLPFGDGIPFVDKTGLQGTYSFNFILTLVRGAGRDQPEFDPPLSVALEDQIGFKLESQKVPTDFIVVEQAVKPSGTGANQ
jgi:uncharacterized protein (TIGR03435 family)